jgi:flavin reductase (DIM6/NTAB) family NADH-FMN oxidoreductase RutF
MVTGVGLITTYTEERGPNVMAAEWTMTVSHNPPLVLVVVHSENATNEMITKSGEFGVNLAADDQSDLVSLAGSFTRYQTDKFSSGNIRTFQGKKIRAPMIEGAVVNAECILKQTVSFGDYTGFVGEVVEISHNPEKRPIAYHLGRTWKIQNFEKPPTLYVTATPSAESKQIKAEGRMRGGSGMIELNLVRNGEVSESASTNVDVRGFYGYDWPIEDNQGDYEVHAKSGKLIASARTGAAG